MEEVVSGAAKSIVNAIVSVGQPSAWVVAGVIVSIVLAIITGVYVVLVFLQLKEMRQQRVSSFRPVIVVEAEKRDDKMRVDVTNTGNAMGLNIRLWFDPEVCDKNGDGQGYTIPLIHAICPFGNVTHLVGNGVSVMSPKKDGTIVCMVYRLRWTYEQTTQESKRISYEDEMNIDLSDMVMLGG